MLHDWVKDLFPFYARVGDSVLVGYRSYTNITFSFKLEFEIRLLTIAFVIVKSLYHCIELKSGNSYQI